MSLERGVLPALLLAAVGLGTSPSAFAEGGPQPPKHFLVLLRLGPGYDEALPIRGQKGFPAHAAYMNDLEQKGKVVFGGPLLESFASMQPTGAVLVVRADTPDEARQIAAGDPSGMLEVQEVRAFLLAVANTPSPRVTGAGEPGDASNLRSWIGKYPTDQTAKPQKRLFEVPQIKAQLGRLLGEKDRRLLTQTYSVETPIELVENHLVAVVCKPHCCPCENGILAVDLATGSVVVGLWDGKEHWFGGGAALPRAVRDAFDHLHSKP